MATFKKKGDSFSLTDLTQKEAQLIYDTMLCFNIHPFVKDISASTREVPVARKLFKVMEPLKDQIRTRKKATAEERIS